MLTAKKCECGAITVTGDDFENSMRPEVFAKEFPDVPFENDSKYFCCNHCVNHYGIDICGCGSGQPVGKCDNDFDECIAGMASQTKGVARESAVVTMFRRGGF